MANGHPKNGHPTVVTRKDLLRQATVYAEQMGTTREAAFRNLDAGKELPHTLAGAQLEGVYAALRAK